MEKEYYKEYYEYERKHWWFTARLEILETLLTKRIIPPNKKKFRILNAGVATGATTIMLQKHGEVTSLEYDKDCCLFLEEVVKIEVTNGSLTDLPYEDNYFDLVCAFDVVEHIEDDALAIKEMNRVLKKDGTMFLTVPAFNFLWSEHDVINHHFRRYTLKGLSSIVKDQNFDIQFKSYFNFILFLPIFFIRMLGKLLPKRDSEKVAADFEGFNGNKFGNKLFFFLFRKESFFLKNKIRFPFGVSLFVIAKK